MDKVSSNGDHWSVLSATDYQRAQANLNEHYRSLLDYVETGQRVEGTVGTARCLDVQRMEGGKVGANCISLNDASGLFRTGVPGLSVGPPARSDTRADDSYTTSGYERIRFAQRMALVGTN